MTEIRRLKYCVNGEWKESGTDTYWPITDSSTGEVLAEAPACTPEEVNEAIAAAKAAFPAWAATPIGTRVGYMFRLKEVLEAHLEELTQLVARELGKNLREARGDVLKAIEGVEVACSAPFLMQGDSLFDVSRGFDTVMYREPLGVFAGIVPFNFPAMIPWGWMIPMAITTGNTFVLKASDHTPLTAIRILELAYQEVGLPRGVVNLITCAPEESELLLKHPDVRGVSFVGSTPVGQKVYGIAASHGKRVQALCGAKNHGLVLRDADIENAARVVINSTFGCAGQRCMALPVVVVEEAVADEFVAKLTELARELKVGCAYDPATDLGPVVTARHRERIHRWIEQGLADGAELVLDGRDVVVPGFEGGYFVGPTIFDHVKPGMVHGEAEIFGPVTSIKRVRDFEEGLVLMNAHPLANGSCIFTENGHYAREFMRRTDAGMVGVNVGIPVPVSYFPFSGHKSSFFGDLHVLGKDGVRFYTQVKSVTTRWFQGRSAVKVGTWEGSSNRE